jgi:hypothetical protein
MHTIAITATTAPTAAAECFRRGGTSVAATGNRLVGGTRKHASHLPPRC